MVATQTDSAVFSFLPHSIGSPVKGSRQLAAEGLTAISSSLRPVVARRERIYPFRLPRFCRHLPVGIPQKTYWHNVNAPLKNRAINDRPYDVGFSTGKVGTCGTDKSVPYKGAAKNLAVH